MIMPDIINIYELKKFEWYGVCMAGIEIIVQQDFIFPFYILYI